MLFNFPKKRINDTGWFLSKTEVLTFGVVRLITIAVSEFECKTYYRFIDDDDVEYTVAEEQVLDNDVVIPTPKFAVGDGVVYTSLNQEGQHEQKVDIIKHVEIALYEKNIVEISYVMEHDEEEGWVLEDEILCHGEPVIDMRSEREVETKENGFSEYDYCGTGGSDV